MQYLPKDLMFRRYLQKCKQSFLVANFINRCLPLVLQFCQSIILFNNKRNFNFALDNKLYTLNKQFKFICGWKLNYNFRKTESYSC